MIYQEIQDRILEIREELVEKPTMPTTIQYTFLKILEVMNAMATKSRDLEEWNHQAWIKSDELQARLKDPR